MNKSTEYINEYQDERKRKGVIKLVIGILTLIVGAVIASLSFIPYSSIFGLAINLLGFIILAMFIINDKKYVFPSQKI